MHERYKNQCIKIYAAAPSLEPRSQQWNNSASVMQALNSDSDKLKHNETLLFVNDDYCEISRRRPNARYHHLLFRVLTGLMALSVLSFVIFFSVYHRYRRNY